MSSRRQGDDAVSDDVRTIAFVLCPGLTPLDLIGPLQVISGLEVVEATFGMRRRHHVVVVAETLDAVPTDTPVHVAATTLLDEVPEPDIVMVPGVEDGRYLRRRCVRRNRYRSATGGQTGQRRRRAP